MMTNNVGQAEKHQSGDHDDDDDDDDAWDRVFYFLWQLTSKKQIGAEASSANQSDA